MSQNFLNKLERIHHRGPDYTGHHQLNQLNFGHKRLSIIDLDARSHQPFIINNFILLFNGEIYNFKEIKKELIKEGYSFSTDSDTEVLLQGYIHFGDKIVRKLNGMFAFIIYNKKTNRIFGARDRVGQKPLFLKQNRNIIEFASELRPLIGEKEDLDEFSLGNYLLFGTIPKNRSIIEGIKKIEPANFFECDLEKNTIKYTKYWDFESVSRNLNWKTDYLSDFKSIFFDATKKRLLESDVKTGVFLSGGIDSTLVTKYATQSSNNVSTLSVIFEEDKFSEHKYSQFVAEKYGTKHKPIVCSVQEVQTFIGDIGSYLDEPMADSSFLAQLLISKVASENGYKVVLTGDGADEFFMGYKRYIWIKKLNNYKKLRLHRILPKFIFPKKLRRYIDVMNIDDLQMYDYLMSGLDMKNFKRIFNKLKNKENLSYNGNLSFLENCVNKDKSDYLVNDINIKVDRGTMAFSIESRSPFLDYRVMDFANSLPVNYKLIGKKQKVFLKDILSEDFDDNFLYRDKQGFGVPLGKWLQENFFEELLLLIDRNFNLIENFFERNYIDGLILELKRGNYNNHHILWRLYVLFNWYEKIQKDYHSTLE